jgi:hypothetical protein
MDRVEPEGQEQASVEQGQHHPQQPQPAGVSPPATCGGGKHLRCSPLFWRVFLGLLGGLVAWGAGEIPRRWSETPLPAFTAYSAAAAKISDAVRSGDLTTVQGVDAMNKLNHANGGNPYVRIVNNRSYAPREKAYRVQQLRHQDEGKMRIGPLIWFSMVGLLLAVFLNAADGIVVRNGRGATIHACAGALLGLVGGFVVCLFFNEPYWTIPGSYADGANLAGLILARSAGWAVLGLFLGIAPGILLWNVKRLRIGMAGGLVGGLVGGALFEPVCLASGNDVAGRLVALVAVGVVTGLVTTLIENAIRTAWLRVVAGPLAGGQFILYRDPTCIGRSPRGEIYLFHEPRIGGQHAVIRVVEGGYEIEDLHMGVGTFVNGRPIDRTRLSSGDQVQIGSTCFVFQAKARTA